MKTFLTILIAAGIGATAVWFLKPQSSPGAGSASAAGERKVLFYQSAMHPWIKSDKPGRCTICGMELTPVYEGDKGFDATGGENTVALTQTQIQVLHVQTVTARIEPLVRKLQVAGMIDDDATRHRYISAYVDGRVDKLHVNFVGAEVTKGQPLADFYSPSLLQTEREYRQLTGDLRQNAALRLRQMGLSADQISALESKPLEDLHTPILAPMTGTVVAQSVYEGQYVAAGERLFEIADFSTMWFMFRAYELDMPWIKLGQKVTVSVTAIPGKTFEGKVTFIDPNFDEATRSTKVRVELANPAVDGRRELLHRLYADGTVEVEYPPVLTLPRSAVIQTGTEAVVYVDREGGAFERVPVKLGRRGDALVEIKSGIAEGDKVVTNGNMLIDGQAEMNRSFMTAPEKKPVAVDVAKLTAPQASAMKDLLKVSDAMAAALAADDLQAFHKASEPATTATNTLISAMGNKSPSWKAVDDAKQFVDVKDLAAARKAFHRFTTAVTAAVEPYRNQSETPPFHLWECPMVDQAIPGVPKKGRWIQIGDRPGQNPFFGAAMRECGKEIQP